MHNCGLQIAKLRTLAFTNADSSLYTLNPSPMHTAAQGEDYTAERLKTRGLSKTTMEKITRELDLKCGAQDALQDFPAEYTTAIDARRGGEPRRWYRTLWPSA